MLDASVDTGVASLDGEVQIGELAGAGGQDPDPELGRKRSEVRQHHPLPPALRVAIGHGVAGSAPTFSSARPGNVTDKGRGAEGGARTERESNARSPVRVGHPRRFAASRTRRGCSCSQRSRRRVGGPGHRTSERAHARSRSVSPQKPTVKGEKRHPKPRGALSKRGGGMGGVVFLLTSLPQSARQ